MIIRNGKEITSYYHGNSMIMQMYRGKVLIYEVIRSCYGNGYWINDAPFLNTDGWKNNK